MQVDNAAFAGLTEPKLAHLYFLSNGADSEQNAAQFALNDDSARFGWFKY